MTDDVEQARHEVRFALAQLRARNGQHEFETLARMLARATVTRNVLPATGPVASGGDQGRDFETYPTNLPGQIQKVGRELGVPDGASVGFACTLQQGDLRAKIREDVAKIVADGTHVDFVLAYCEADIPVARRHAIERDARDRFQVTLTVFDGNAIAELLTDHATFWIAETYLHLPARVLPVPVDRPDWYETDLVRWRADTDPIDTVGRLIDLAGCLHYACSTQEGRPDVPYWLERLESALEPSRARPLRRRALYECIVANIRGLGTLVPVDERAAEYLTEAAEASNAQELADAGLVLMYVCGALGRAKTGHTAETLRAWNVGLSHRIEELLAADPAPGTACVLLDALGSLRLQPDAVAAQEAGSEYAIRGEATDLSMQERMEALVSGNLTPVDVPLVDPAGAIDAYARLVTLLPAAPLFPVEMLGKVLSLSAPVLVDQPNYDQVVDAIDTRLAATSGEAAAAERALERCQALNNAGRRVAALKQLHRARNGLFNGDAREQMIQATLATSVAYRDLGLHMAAKQYALAASYLTSEGNLSTHSIGLAYAAFADYHQGAWCSAAHLNCDALQSHRLLAERPMDFNEHRWLSGSFFELTQIQALARKAGGDLDGDVEDAIARNGVGEFLDQLKGAALASSPGWWENLSLEDYVGKVITDLGRPPFDDTTTNRHIRFECLGVTWTVTFHNDYRDVAVGERFAAALQITLAQLTDSDLGLLPMNRTVCVTARSEGAAVQVEELESSPDESRLGVALPAIASVTEHSVNARARDTLVAVTTAIIGVSTLDDDRFHEILVAAMEDQLLTNVSFAVSYDVLWRAAVSEASFDSRPRAVDPLSDPVASTAEPHQELAVRTTPGPGYDLEKSRGEIEHRYTDLPPRMKATLDGLREDAGFAAVVAMLRSDGWSDWQIMIAVHNVAKNARHKFLAPANEAEAKAFITRFMEPEPDGDPIPADQFSADSLRQALLTTIASSAQTWWNLQVRPQPIPADAVHQLLRSRYGWADDDIDHADPFANPTSTAER